MSIGSILAQAGATSGANIGSAMSGLGGDIRGMLTGVGQGINRRGMEKEAEQLLAANKDNPAALMEAARQFAIQGNREYAAMFQQAAQAAQANRDKLDAGQLEMIENLRTTRQTARDKREQDRLEANAVALAKTLEKSEEEKKAIIAGLRGATPEELRKFLASGGKDKEGSKAANQVKIEEVVEDGRVLKYSVTIDTETGQLVDKVLIGEVAGKAEERGRDAWKNPEIESYNIAVSDQRSAASEARKYDNLLTETLELAGEAGQISDGVGGFFGTARDFVISDVAGLGDAITVHRSRLNEVRMKNAIALLPRGPASDRDVKLALTASVDPKNLSPEDRIRYIRGMKKIADAEKAYMDGKLRWIEQTGDPLAFGYERKVSLDGLNNLVDALESDFPEQVSILKSELAKAAALRASGDTEGAVALIAALKAEDSIGYIEALDMRASEQQRYNSFVEANQIKFY